MKRRNTKNTAFVLNMDCNGLAVVRSLGREGVPAVGIDFRRNVSGLRSRHCIPLVEPHPSKEPESLLARLLNIGRQLSKKGVLYPTSDAYLLFISRFRKELSEFFLHAISSQDVIEQVVNKRSLYVLAEKAGIPYPQTHYPKNMQEVETIEDQIEYPAFVKPYYSHVWYEKFENKGFRVNNPRELTERYRVIFRAKLEAVVQSVVVGPNTNHVKVCAYISEKHEPLAALLTRKIRQYPIDFGIGTYMETVHDQDLLQTTIDFFRRINYRGIGSIEFKKDDRDGRYRMIELNARLWTQNMQAACAGINFPLVQYVDLTGGEFDLEEDYRDGIRWINVIEDFLVFNQLNRLKKLSLGEWVRSIWGADAHAYFSKDDLRPFLWEYASKLRNRLALN